jgi:hypothetical protein
VPRDFFDLPNEELDVVLVDHATIERAERRLVSCEYCDPTVEFPFEWLLDRMLSRDPSKTAYVLECPAKCFQCGHEIRERTLVDWEDYF